MFLPSSCQIKEVTAKFMPIQKSSCQLAAKSKKFLPNQRSSCQVLAKCEKFLPKFMVLAETQKFKSKNFVNNQATLWLTNINTPWIFIDIKIVVLDSLNHGYVYDIEP